MYRPGFCVASHEIQCTTLAPSDEGAVGVSRLRERKSCALQRMKNRRADPKPLPRSAAPLRVAKRRRGETVARQRLRGRQSSDTSRWKKKEQSINNIHGTAQRPSPTRKLRIPRRFKHAAAHPNHPVGDGLSAVPQSRLPPHITTAPVRYRTGAIPSQFQISARINTPRPSRSYAWRACRSRRRPRRASPARRGCSARTSPPSPSCPARTAGRRTTWS